LLNNLIPGRQEALFPSAWTLTLEVLFYVAVPVLALAVRSRWRSISAERLARLVIISWIASIVFTTIADLQGDGEVGLWLRGSLPAMWQMFCPGILLAIVPHLQGRHQWAVAAQGRLAIGIAIAALVPAAILSSAAPLDYGVVAYQLLVDASRPLFAVGYGLIIAAAIRGRAWGARRRWPFELGLISYGIYLIHPLVIDLLLRVHGSPLRQDDLVGFLVNTSCVTALIIPLSLVSWRYFERGFIRLGRRDDGS
jgi:peptidoglycan/LPS O-acetylase OafA/YrhL